MVLPMSRQRLAIYNETLLLCERREIAQFVQAYVRYLHKQKIILPQSQFLIFRRLEQLPVLARRLPLIPGSERVRRIIFFADAGNNLEERRELLDAVRGSECFSKIPYCAHFFFPGRLQGKRWRSGYLEDLLLEALRPETTESGDFINLYNVCQEYVDSVNNCRGQKNRLSNRSRHVLCAYLAATEKYAGASLDEAVTAGAFALEGERFACLRKCLEKSGE